MYKILRILKLRFKYLSYFQDLLLISQKTRSTNDKMEIQLFLMERFKLFRIKKELEAKGEKFNSKGDEV